MNHFDLLASGDGLTAKFYFYATMFLILVLGAIFGRTIGVVWGVIAFLVWVAIIIVGITNFGSPFSNF